MNERDPADPSPGEVTAPARAAGSTASRVRSAYDEAATRYHEKFSAYSAYRKKVRQFLGEVPTGSRVLDLGCGSGFNARLILDAGLAVKGYDFSEAMLEIARRDCPEGEFELADLRELSESELFDAVLASFCIVHFLDHEAEAFLERLPGVMKPGSLLYVSFMEGREPTWESPSFSEQPFFYNYFDRDWVVGILSAVGLELVSVSTHDYAERDGPATIDVFLQFRKA